MISSLICPLRTAIPKPEVLAQDPRPSYQHDPERVYGMPFAGVDVRFIVKGDVLTVCEVVPYEDGNKCL